MKLDAYLKSTGQKPMEFARKIGCSRSRFYRFLSGERVPDKEMMQKIALASGCHVTANDFFEIVPAESG